MTFRMSGEPHEDKRLRQMIFLSAVLHVAVIVWVVLSGYLTRSTRPRAVAYTVELVNPAALGSNLPGGGKSGGHVEAEPGASPKPASSLPPSPQPAKSSAQVVQQEEVKSPPPAQQKEIVKIPEKEKPVAKLPVKPEPEKVKVEEQKLEVKKPEPKLEPPKVVKVEEPKPEAKKPEPKPEVKTPEPKPEPKKTEVKPEPEKSLPKKIEEKKPEPKPTETKPQKVEVKPEKLEKEVAKAEAQKPSVKTEEKTIEEKPTQATAPQSEDTNRQIAAALERVKARVQLKDGIEGAEEAKGSGPVTKGGEAGLGGGGTVRGLEFILYTQQLQRRVQESWIVTEKKPGLLAAVSFKIQVDGEVQEVELMKSSGDSAFDQSVLRAVRKSAPFPPPPQTYAQEFASQKIVMNFGGEGRVN